MEIMALSRYVTLGGLEIHYTEWGNQHANPVLCFHGFSRTGRDFDVIAKVLAHEYRVICPDLPGRGLSQWSNDPNQDYTLEAYGHVALDLCDALGVDKLRCIGTSLGGSLGIYVAADLVRDRITHLVVNDVGPGPEAEPRPEELEGLRRIISYLSNPPEFRTMTEMEEYYRTTYATFNIKTEEFWQSFTETSTRRKDNGGLTPNYDPKILNPFIANPQSAQLWDKWDTIQAKVLVLRGKDSDILSAETAEKMANRGPGCRVVTIPDCGHAPSLTEDSQISVVVDFLQT